MDYCVVKIPRLPFDKFINAKRTLTTQMKATGEVMSICTNFEGGLMKAIRSLAQHVDCLETGDYDGMSDEDVLEKLDIVDDRRIYLIAEILRRGLASYDKIHEITKIDKWFIDKLAILVEMEKKLKACGRQYRQGTHEGSEENGVPGQRDRTLDPERPRKRSSSSVMSMALPQHLRWLIPVRQSLPQNIHIIIAAFDGVNEVEDTTKKKKIIVLGSGPIRIGQGIEFDYCSVHSVWTLMGRRL